MDFITDPDTKLQPYISTDNLICIAQEQHLLGNTVHIYSNVIHIYTFIVNVMAPN